MGGLTEHMTIMVAAHERVGQIASLISEAEKKAHRYCERIGDVRDRDPDRYDFLCQQRLRQFSHEVEPLRREREKIINHLAFVYGLKPPSVWVPLA